jgi:beta-glucosidase
VEVATPGEMTGMKGPGWSRLARMVRQDGDGATSLQQQTWPPGFVWGAATSAFQIEGAAEQRGRSIWDALCEEPGRILDGGDARVACDHVHRFTEDVGLLGELGVDAYRFSVSWPRVQPGGRGEVSPDGVGFYDRLVDHLLAAGVQPWVTLYHWDLPEELEAAGGWPGRDIADHFTEYALAVHDVLGDRVRHWTTLNEPWCSAWLGYGQGEHAPGLADRGLAARASHHLLLAHGRAVRALRAQAPGDHQFGVVLNLFPARAVTGKAGDPEVADAVRVVDGVQNRWWLDAVLNGSYPADVLDLLEPHLEGVVADGDLDEIRAPLDLLGVNYCNDQLVDLDGPAERTLSGAYPVPERITAGEPEGEATAMGWPVTPDGLREILVRIGRDYPDAPPLVVTENGSAQADPVPAPDDDVVEDQPRVEYLRAHLDATVAALRDGADVRGYFAWSLLDNFEWAWGYSQRFGLVHVDFETQRRRRKRSFEEYRAAIAAARRHAGALA